MNSNKTDVKVGRIVITPGRCLSCLCIALVMYSAVGLLIVQLGRRNLTDIIWTAGDWTLVSCAILAFAGMWLSRDLGKRFEITLSRLLQRGALISETTGEPVSPQLLSNFMERMQARANTGAICGGLVLFVLVGCLMAAGEIPKIQAGQSVPSFLWNMTAVVIYTSIGFMGGLVIGRAITYSFLAFALKQDQISIKIMPGHPDGAAGMKPIGNLFFLQASLAALPALFVGGWYLLIVFSPVNDEAWTSLRENYQQPFQVFFFAMMGIEVFGFIFPMWLFHCDMSSQKTVLFEVADKLSERITLLKAQLVETTDDNDREVIQSELRLAVERHEDIEELPTWPVSFRLWRQFVIGNLFLALPVLLELARKILMSKD